jgi:hypothetical protein
LKLQYSRLIQPPGLCYTQHGGQDVPTSTAPRLFGDRTTWSQYLKCNRPPGQDAALFQQRCLQFYCLHLDMSPPQFGFCLALESLLGVFPARLMPGRSIIMQRRASL